MEKKDFELNNMLLNEIGLDISSNNSILIDQDTGTPITIKGKYMVAPNSKIDKNVVEFDPINNIKQMNLLFGYYVQKLAENEEIIPIRTYYPIETDPKNGRGIIECKTEDNNTIRSREYINDNIKYADLIFKLNGDITIDLSKYDKPKQKSSSKKKTLN